MIRRTSAVFVIFMIPQANGGLSGYRLPSVQYDDNDVFLWQYFQVGKYAAVGAHHQKHPVTAWPTLIIFVLVR